ncbi:MAG: 50S ribosomal protein L25/general stress protein Ctc [Gammaproteobacteria bacterium]|nr:MAG: 50S ribosomal protein L25/general stress protein Ctc [Gammaproteobacteria bacterium]
MNEFELKAEVREDLGKGASRRLRRSGKMPAILYGGDEAPVSLALRHDDLFHALENEAFYSHVITLHIGKKKVKAVLKDIQRHPWKPIILHADFQRVKAGEVIRMHVPVHFINEDKCHGVKNEGGLLVHNVNELEVLCEPKNLPEYIEVDVADLKAGETIHLSEIEAPKGVQFAELVHGHDLALVTVSKKGGEADTSGNDEDASEGEGEEA